MLTQVTEIWQLSPTLIIFWRYMCRFIRVVVVEAVEGGLRSFHNLYTHTCILINEIIKKKLFEQTQGKRGEK